MTTTEINVAIAEWLGVKYHKPTPEEIKSGSYYQYEPNYYSDLNAIHEAEKWLEKKHSNRCQDYVDWVKRSISTGPVGRFRLIHATAPQRCEALLRTIGKWVEP